MASRRLAPQTRHPHFSEGTHARRVGGARMRPPATSGWEALRGAGLLACDDAWRHQPGDSPAVARALNSLARRPNNRPVSYCKHMGSQMSVLWRASARHLPMTARPWAEAHGCTLKRAPLGLSAPRRWQCYFLTSPYNTVVLVRHRVDDVVRNDPEGQRGELLVVLRPVRPLPRVAEIHVVADR